MQPLPLCCNNASSLSLTCPCQHIWALFVHVIASMCQLLLRLRDARLLAGKWSLNQRHKLGNGLKALQNSRDPWIRVENELLYPIKEIHQPWNQALQSYAHIKAEITLPKHTKLHSETSVIKRVWPPHEIVRSKPRVDFPEILGRGHRKGVENSSQPAIDASRFHLIN